MSGNGWIGVDLDGTLASYDHWRGIDHIGDPVPAMLARVKAWLAEGREVRIFTARVCYRVNGDHIRAELTIHDYLRAHGLMVDGDPLAVTNVKDFAMIELWDDRAVQVEANTGLAYVHPHSLHRGPA